MSVTITGFGRLFLTAGVAVLFAAASLSPAVAYKEKPAGGKYKDCHGYVLEAKDKTLRVHCLDGTPADLSFALPITQDVLHADGTVTQVKDLTVNTPVHVRFTQSLNGRKAYQIFLVDPNATGDYGFKT